MLKPPMRRVGLKPLRVIPLSVLVAAGALLLAACGNSPHNAAVAHLGGTTTSTAASSQSGNSAGADSGSASASSGSGPSAQSSSFAMAGGGSEAQMLSYAECMRAHGVPNFPDPNSQGQIQGNGINPGSPSFQSADKDCRHILPNGGKPTAAQQAQAEAQALKFSQCMRSHGISDFPDPQTQPGGGVGIRISATPGSDLNPQNPQFQAAQKACQGIMGGPLGAKSTASGPS